MSAQPQTKLTPAEQAEWDRLDEKQRVAVAEDRRRGAEQAATRRTVRAKADANADGRATGVHAIDAEKLADLLGLTEIGLEILGARIVGRGASASADLYLSDGISITFDSLRDFANPTRLAVELAACTGATPRLKVPQAITALALLRSFAEHVRTLTADQEAVDWGCTYLQHANLIDVDMSDQTERWGAFQLLDDRSPRSGSFLEGSSLAAATTVLRAPDGTRYVRCGWFRDVVRHEHPAVSAREVAHRMERVGWSRRGESGRIKATRPSTNEYLAWSFYMVSAGWEDQW